MRLICPNCDAQYEVDASLIPLEGRDVQCSDCGHVWFQFPDETEFEDENWQTGPEQRAAHDAEPAHEPEGEPEPTPDTARQAEPPDQDVPDVSEAPFHDDDDHLPEDEIAAQDVPDDGPDPGVLKRHSLDETLLSVLREEAELEARARAEDAARASARGLEMQPELGLTEAEETPRLRIRPRNPEPASDATDLSIADDDENLRDLTATAAAGRASRPARRDLLPDIEEINSTLRASGSARPEASDAAARLPDPPEPRRKGFRTGFLTVLAIAVIGTLLYAQSPRIVEKLPQAAPALTAYVAAVDKARAGLDALVKALLTALQDEG